MIIPPFVAGAVMVILVEVAFLLALAISSAIRRVRRSNGNKGFRK